MCRCNELTIPYGPIGPQGIPGTNGTNGAEYTPVTYYVNDNNNIIDVTNSSLSNTDSLLVIPSLPAGTYIAMFEADSTLTRNTTTAQITTLIYRVNGIARGLYIDPSTDTSNAYKLSMNIQFTITSPTTINVTYVANTFTDTTTSIKIYARSLVLIKVA
jgi:hypothetical protein